MRKLFSMLLISVVTLVSCNKDNNGPEDGVPCPVTGIELPQSSAATPIEPGETITIQGNGFASNCEIWLYAAVPSKAAGKGVRAEIEEVTAAFVRFVTPSVSGLQTIELRQDGGAWKLGEMYCREGSDNPGGEIEILPKRISHICVTWSEDMTFVLRYTYDAEGRIVAITETDRHYIYEGAPDEPLEDRITTMEYAPDRIVVTEPEGCQSIHTLTDGRTTSIKGIPSASAYPSDYTFTYDANGYIAENTWAENADASSHGPLLRGTYIYTITDGSLVRTEEQTYEIGTSSPIDTEPTVHVYENDPSRFNNLNIDLFGLIDFSELDLDHIYLLGTGGNRLRTLPVKIDYGDGEIETYRYTMDGEYISQIEMFDEDSDLLTLLEIFYDSGNE